MEKTNDYPMARPMMSFPESVKTVFHKYATFEGRARRSEYWWWALFYTIVSIVIIVIDLALGWDFHIAGESMGYGPLTLILALFFFLPNLAVTIRRLHDIGYSGWYYLFVLIPIIGSLLLLWWVTRNSQRSENEYGPSPKYYNPDYGITPQAPEIETLPDPE